MSRLRALLKIEYLVAIALGVALGTRPYWDPEGWRAAYTQPISD